MASRSDPIARVYAAALIELGREKGTLGQLYDELHALQGTVASDPRLRAFFASPRFDREQKWQAVRRALEGRVHRQVLGLLRVLIEKGRETAFNNVVEQFDRFKDLAENRVHAHVTVATPMGDAFRASLTKRLESASGRNVQLHERVDAGVLGGASIRIGDRVIDRTLRTRLAALRRRLESEESLENVKR